MLDPPKNIIHIANIAIMKPPIIPIVILLPRQFGCPVAPHYPLASCVPSRGAVLVRAASAPIQGTGRAPSKAREAAFHLGRRHAREDAYPLWSKLTLL